MKKILNIIGMFLAGVSCTLLLVVTWQDNRFVVFRGFDQFPISQRLLLGIGAVMFLAGGVLAIRQVRE